MLTFKNTLLCILPIFLLVSCDRPPCEKANYYIALTSFTNAESDTIVIRRFTKASNFTSLKDTFLLSETSSHFQRNNDTLLVLQPIEQNNSITSTYDYEVFLPGANKLFQISDIVENILTNNSGLGKVGCDNTFNSYQLNGQLVSVANTYGIVYLNK